MQTTRASFHTCLLTSAVKMAAVCLALASVQARAQATSMTWYGADSVIGGDGIWDWTDVQKNVKDMHKSFKSNDNLGQDFKVWVQNDIAIFSGVGGRVEIQSAILTSGLQFTGTGYSLVGNGGSLRFVGTDPSIVLGGGSTTFAVDISRDAASGTAPLLLTGGGVFTYGRADLFADATAINLDGNTTLNLAAFSDTVGGFTLTNGTVSGTSSLTASSYTLANGVVNAVLDGDTSVGLTKSGLGTVTLNASNTYKGRTAVTAGQLYLGADNAIAKTSLVQITGGTLTAAAGFNQYIQQADVTGGQFVLNGRLNSIMGMSVSGSGVFTGTGDARGSDVVIGSGGAIAPGSVGAVGVLTTGSLTLNSAGSYRWDVNLPVGAAGAAGTDWDLISVIGKVTVGATGSSPFVLNVNGFGAGPLPTTTSSISWAIATYTGSMVNFSNDRFSVQLGGTWKDLNASLFSVTNENNTLYLTMAVPEPKDYAMILGAITLGLVGYRRWRRSAQAA